MTNACRSFVWMGLIGAFSTSLAAAPPGRSDGADSPEADLVPLLESYFKSDDSRRQLDLGKRIERVVGGDLARLSDALGRLDLWAAPTAPTGTFTCGTTGGALPVHFTLPESYDATKRHPMMLCLPGAGVPAQRALAAAEVMLGEATRDFVRVAPGRAPAGGFHQPVDTTTELEQIMKATRRHFHLDTDRVFLFGLGDSADTAWMLAINRPDLFAGAICVSGYPPLPYPEQSYPVMLANLRRLPVLTVWMAGPGQVPSGRRLRVASHNEAIVDFASKASLPIRGAAREVPADVETATEAADAIKPSVDDVRWLLGHRRTAATSPVSHWFRYPSYGKAGWIEQTAFLGDVWTAEQLAIATASAGDRDTFIADTIKSKLAFIEATVERQTIRITTLRCGRVELLLPMGLVDSSRPVTIMCNGKRRAERAIKPSVSTMLETASTAWEFQRLTAARVSFSIRADSDGR